MKNQLPAPFVSWLQSYIGSPKFTSVRRLQRGLILRWCLWRDGCPGNALPGYSAPPPAGPNGIPRGWSVSNLRDIAAETLGRSVLYR